MPLLTITASADNWPVGNYKTKFQGIENLETDKGAAYRWIFRTADGKTITALSDAVHPPTVKNKTGRWLSALSGKPLTAGVNVQTDDFIGKDYLVVMESYNDSTRVALFTAI
jgi:hypothetical protein